MRLVTLKLHHFRNHIDTSFEFGQGTNVLLGDNGEGKTNVLEAISFLCLTKSFFTSSDAPVVNFEKDMFEIAGKVQFESGVEQYIRVAYSQFQGEKSYTINKRHIEPFSSVIGTFPIVICSPEHTPITSGAPVERRRFVDFIISQSNALYFQQLLEYKKVLKQRNKILLDSKISKRDNSSLLEPWDKQVAKLSGHISIKRREFVHQFREFIASAYHHLVGQEEPTIEYEPSVTIDDDFTEARICETISAKLKEHRSEEVRTGTTLVGPHRDEFSLKINGLDLRKFASQGQHKTFLVALKIGEFFYLKERCRETPIFLLDDVFNELDKHRAQRLLHFVGELSQTFVTSTDPHIFDNVLSFRGNDRKFSIQHGALVEDQSMVVL